MTITEKGLTLLSATGAALLLTAWLFQQLYAESASAQRAALAEIELKMAPHEAAIPILKHPGFGGGLNQESGPSV